MFLLIILCENVFISLNAFRDYPKHLSENYILNSGLQTQHCSITVSLYSLQKEMQCVILQIKPCPLFECILCMITCIWG